MNGHRGRTGAAPGWTPVDRLSELARALLSDDLGGRDAVPAHVADRVRALAGQWAAHGFTARTVGPWSDLPPPCAAYLVSRAVPPNALDELVDVGGPAGKLTVRTALSTGRLTAAQAYEALGATSSARPDPRAPVTPPGQAPDPPATRDTPRAPVGPAPVVFSHPDQPGGDEHGVPRPGSRPSRTPFRR